MKVNKKALAVAGVAALALVGGSFAYYSQTLSLDNPLDTGKYGSAEVEKFTPPTDDWKPGESWDKDVHAENTGDYPVLVRVKMAESWSPKENVDGSGRTVGTAYKTIESSGENKNFLGTDGTYNKDTKAFTANQGGAAGDTDGLVLTDSTVVYKQMAENNISADKDANKWIYNSGDGYWYWNGVLKEGAVTDDLLDGLVLATNVDMGKHIVNEYYAFASEEPEDGSDSWKPAPWNDFRKELEEGSKTDADKRAEMAAEILKWVDTTEAGSDHYNKDLQTNLKNGVTMWRKSTSELDGNAPGYADSYYTLTVTSEFVQANTDAVEAAWPNTADWRKENLTNITSDSTDANILVSQE